MASKTQPKLDFPASKPRSSPIVKGSATVPAAHLGSTLKRSSTDVDVAAAQTKAAKTAKSEPIDLADDPAESICTSFRESSASCICISIL